MTDSAPSGTVTARAVAVRPGSCGSPVHGYFAKWQHDGVFAQLNGLLRRLVRETEGRDTEPSTCVLDSQTVKASADAPRSGQGTDAGKRIIGRNRHLGCDTLGRLLTVLVTVASISDTAAGVTLLSRIATHPHVRKARMDARYRTTAIEHGARLGRQAWGGGA
ncbi:transposase [Streptomyces tauricus]|uniref:transposase n=1 Tax=Streptomyces tauricus TaxID=68274 RepID=UPI003F4D3427